MRRDSLAALTSTPHYSPIEALSSSPGQRTYLHRVSSETFTHAGSTTAALAVV
jgi:hypothetical protein